MPFSRDVREDALVRSGRYCCACGTFAGRDIEVHHIVSEADGGPDTIDNAIPLCSRCHGEAGHYNPRHPRGTKYSPDELRRHRDEWWTYRANNYEAKHRPTWFREPPNSGRGVPVQRRDVGVLWSRMANIAIKKETIEFEAHFLAEDRFEDQSVVRFTELFERADGTYFVYVMQNHRRDWCDAWLDGAPPDDPPLTLQVLHHRYPALATVAGLQCVRRV